MTEQKTNLQKIAQVHGYILGVYLTTSFKSPLFPVIEEALNNITSVMSFVAQKEKEAGIEYTS